MFWHHSGVKITENTHTAFLTMALRVLPGCLHINGCRQHTGVCIFKGVLMDAQICEVEL